MAEVRGQREDLAVDIEAGPIPALQSACGEGVADIVNARIAKNSTAAPP
jgi:hypothetical protein